jgi:RNA polymerase sigma-70 factor, ECF subfamily
MVGGELFLAARLPPTIFQRFAMAAEFFATQAMNLDRVFATASGADAASSAGLDRTAPPRLDAATAQRFRDVMLPHLDAAHNLARFLCRDADAAQDIVQEAYLRAYRSFASYRGGGDRAWILSIVRNCCHDWWSDFRRTRVIEPLDEAAEFGTDVDGDPAPRERRVLPRSEETPETSLLERTEAAQVRRHLEAMPEPFREILILRELEDLSYREIAEVTATPIGTVMSRLARARKLFQAAWERSTGNGKQPG